MLAAAGIYLRTLPAQLRSDEGAGFTEYVLLIIAIAIVVLVGLGLFSGGLNTLFSNLGSDLGDTSTNIPS